MARDKADTVKELTRRRFLRGLGTGAVIAASASVAGVDSVFAVTPPEKAPKQWQHEADVVVVGFGAAGAATALEAAKSGAKVIILEKMAQEGGATRLSGGVLYAAGTPTQKAAGVEDTPANLCKYLLAVGGGRVDPDLVKLYAFEVKKSIDWLMGLGVEFPTALLYQSGIENVPKYAAITPPQPRGHMPKGRGLALFSILSAAVEKQGIKVLRETPAVGLIPDARGEIQGVKARSKGKELYLRARKAVVITSGDFGRNTEMLRAYSPIGFEAVQVGALGQTGDGLRMAQALGADLTGVYAIGGLPSTAENPTMLALYMPVPLFSGNAPCVAVNSSGRRFFNETIGYTIANMKIFQQEGSFAWTIFDEKARQEEWIVYPNYADKSLNWSKGLTAEIEKGIVLKGATFGELAEKIKVDRQAFEDTLMQYNGHAGKGNDPEFGKTAKLKPLEAAPFYAVKAKPGVLINLGGLRIDTHARVRHVSGKIIPRLYAAGISVTGGFSGELVPTSGLSIGIGITFGRIAGRNAAGEKLI